MKSLAVAAACLLAIAASAQQRPTNTGYTEVSFAPVTIDAGGGIKPTPKLARVSFGHILHKNLDAELMVVATIAKDTYQVRQTNGATTNVDASSNGYGLYFRPNYTLDNGVSLYARAGWIHGEFTAQTVSGNASTTGNSFSYGLGFKAPISKNAYFTADYTSYYKKDGITATGPSIGVGYLY
jgi:hypothetical protein